MKNITRRQAAKAITIGTAAAFIAPAALASADPDADIIELERQMNHIRNVELPPLEKIADKAEVAVMQAVPHRQPPRYTTLDEVEAATAKWRQTVEGNPILKAMRDDKRADRAGLKSIIFQDDAKQREAVKEYNAYLEAKKRVEAETGYHEKQAAAIEALDRSEALHEKIMAAKPRTLSGLAVQLRALAAGDYYALEVTKAQVSAVAATATEIAGKI